jgi:hypothetical protein
MDRCGEEGLEEEGDQERASYRISTSNGIDTNSKVCEL